MLIVVLRPRRLYMIVSYENTICGPTSAVSITPIDLLGVFGPYQDLTTGQKSKFIGLYPLESTFTFIISSIFIVRATILIRASNENFILFEAFCDRYTLIFAFPPLPYLCSVSCLLMTWKTQSYLLELSKDRKSVV